MDLETRCSSRTNTTVTSCQHNCAHHTSAWHPPGELQIPDQRAHVVGKITLIQSMANEAAAEQRENDQIPRVQNLCAFACGETCLNISSILTVRVPHLSCTKRRSSQSLPFHLEDTIAHAITDKSHQIPIRATTSTYLSV